MTFLIVIAGWIFTLCLHEFSHALVALWGGDWTVREKGYLTFNPLRYTHPVYSLLLPMIFLLLGGIGLPGGAVYIETWRLRSRRWVSATSLAGPMSNLLMAIVLAIILNVAHVTASGIWPGLAFLALLQVMAVILNLIPVPPFDGYGVIEPFLKSDLRMRVDQIRPALTLIVFFALWYLPFVRTLFWGSVSLIANLLGLPLQLAVLGLDQFQFWN